ncbi:MAG: scavenger receptor cysteine-rich domain-containing protein, partial [Myxococcales bacterium]|nr:scavenger receptor cysteine-rich domain-containing protein [Myxococcales bacterium]
MMVDPCVDDIGEDNDDLDHATPVFEGSTLAGLQVCADDDDWGVIVVCDGGTLTVDIAFAVADGDLDLELYAADGTLIDAATSDTDGERLVHTVGFAAPIYLRVFGVHGAENSYALTLSVEGCGRVACVDGGGCAPDELCLEGFCAPAPEGSVRLVDGDTPNQGRIEVLLNDQWGTVCNDSFSVGDGEVACRQLGYPGAVRVFTGASGVDPIWLDEVACVGDEARLVDCPANPVGENDCAHGEDISVECLLPGACAADRHCAEGEACSPQGVCLPAGSACLDAAPVQLDEVVHGDTGDGGSVDAGSCGGAGAEVAHRFVPEADGEYCFSLAGSAIDSVAYVREADCARPDAEVACLDDLPAPWTPQAAVSFAATAGTPYYLFADTSQGGASGAYRAQVTAGPCDLPPPCGPAAPCPLGYLCSPQGACDLGPATCAVPLPSGIGSFSDFTTGLTAEHQGSCGGGGSPEAVFRVQSPIDAPFCVTTKGSDFDTVLYVRSADCAAGAEVACNDDNGLVTGQGQTSAVEVDAAAGVPYSIFVDGFDGASGRFALNIAAGRCPQFCVVDDDCPLGSVCDAAAEACVEGCADDTRCAPGQTCVEGACAALPGACAMPTPIAVGEVALGTTEGAPSEATAMCGGGARGPERVLTFEPPADGPYCLHTRGSDYDTVLHVQTGTCGSGTEVDCNDDRSEIAGLRQSAVDLAATAGTTYHVFVDGFGAVGGVAEGPFRLSVEAGACAPPECFEEADCAAGRSCEDNVCVVL